MFTCDVLVVGAGSGGLATALSAARHGASVLVVERRSKPSAVPRATGISVRTMEILRTWGLADAVRAHGVATDLEAATARTLLDPPSSSGRAGGYPTLREILEVSPVLPLVCPQDLLEPVLEEEIRRLGGEVRRGVRLTGLRVTPDGVHAELAGGARVHARFVVGADGTRSTVRGALGIGLRHLGTWAELLQVVFRPDLTPRLPGLPRPITFVEHPEPGVLLPLGAGRWGYGLLRFDGTRPEIPADWAPLLRAATGFPDLEPEILGVQHATLAAAVATAYRAGPGFLVGDAAHRTTPVAGVGLNTAIQDGHELGWKLAWAARGLAGDDLLDSHEAERAPVGLAVATRSLTPANHPHDGLPADLGRTHRSAVIAASPADDEEDPPAARTDLAARPGERAPHAWVRHAGRQVSTLDLFDGRVTVLTGSDGAGWERGPAADVPLRVLVAGRDLQGRAVERAYRLRPGSAVLVRPDGRVAWRHDGPCADRAAALHAAVATALGRRSVPAALAG
jgi:2-polyprenyl-6-methoxyphenol hydroxylase-like FAD-dependent oxidoreductase